jgi:hypothetical protein
MTNKTFLNRLLAIVAVVVLMPLTGLAQDDGPAYLQVRTMVVKNGSVLEFLELQKQFADAGKAAGQSRAFWQEVRGNAMAYHSVRGVDKLAENDTGFKPPMDDDKWRAWLEAFGETIASTTLQTLRNHPGHAIPPAEGSEPNLMLLRYRTVETGKGNDYRRWIENSLIPALKKGDVKGVSYSQMRLGGNPDMWISATQIPNWAAMDGPGMLGHLSSDEISVLLGPSNAMVTDHEVKILLYRSDLSY